MRIKIVACWVGLALTLAACGFQPVSSIAQSGAPTVSPVGESTTLTVSAAASLAAPFNEIGALFSEQHPGVTVAFNFAGSQQLAAQLANGAPVDVFASANEKSMADAVKSGRIEPDSAEIFAHNTLLVIYPAANPANLVALKDLSRPGVKLVLAASQVRAGQYSLEFLDKAGQDGAFGKDYKDAVLKNVVSFEDNVKSVLAKVALGEADAGLVYSSDAIGESSGQVSTLQIPDALNVIANYPIAVVQDSGSPELAQAFMDLVLSKAGQEILAKNGFISAR